MGWTGRASEVSPGEGGDSKQKEPSDERTCSKAECHHDWHRHWQEHVPLIGMDRRGEIVLRQKFSRGQVEVRLANMPPCLIGMEACVGAHHLSRLRRTAGPYIGSRFAGFRRVGLSPLSPKAALPQRARYRPFVAEAVEELGYEAASKCLGIFSRGRCAITSHTSAPRSRLSGVSGVARYPLISTLLTRAQIATEIRI